MHVVDWFIVAAYLLWIVYTGLKRTTGAGAVEGYFLANRSLPWWAVGLTVMATQMSAITLVGTTGQGYADGMRFVQFYFGLPIAMIILSLTLVPFFYHAKVYTAYEYLERRFDVRTRTLASLLFLLSRGLQAGVIIAAPAVILSIVLGFNLTLTIMAIGLSTTVYTMFGGVQAVTWTDVKQMVVIVAGMAAVAVALVFGLPDDVGIGEALHVAGATGRLATIDFEFNLNETYTFWSGLIGGLFLMLGYFGCDQSQVQRYLTAKSVDAGRYSLLMSAFVKIPLQALILLIGVLVFVFYLFHAPPMLFNPVHEAEVHASSRASEYAALDTEFQDALAARRTAASEAVAARRTGNAAAVATTEAAFVVRQQRLTAIRGRAVSLVKEVTQDDSYTDVNYVFPTFVTTELPVGLVGLMIAAILAAAMSSIAGELNSLSTSTVIDIYRRHLRADGTDQHYLRVSKIVTGFWGLFASIVAMYAANLGSLIEVVNRFGSFFYGSLLGVFILAVATRRATASGALWGLVGGMITVTYVASTSSISFLWLNVVGAIAVVVVGMIVSLPSSVQKPPLSWGQPTGS
ncbi:MAG: sodium:solute symporter [Vicinamibacterales bacterium]|nr:sodium:solute symporter [Vicinamibacterales bacterium]